MSNLPGNHFSGNLEAKNATPAIYWKETYIMAQIYLLVMFIQNENGAFFEDSSSLSLSNGDAAERAMPFFAINGLGVFA